MASIQHLPVELICSIAEFCRPAARSDGQRPMVYLACWVRTSRHFHDILNPLLYKWNFTIDHPLDSAVFWAASKGRLHTIKRAYEYGADLSENGSALHEPSLSTTPYPYIFHIATPLHYAIKHGYRDIFDFLIQVRVDPHVEAQDFCFCDEEPDAQYALHTALEHSKIEGAAEMLIRHLGAYMTSAETYALDDLGPGHDDLIILLVELPGPGPSAAALHYAINMGNTTLAARVLARPNLNASILGSDGQLALVRAVVLDDLPTTKLLLERPEVNVGMSDSIGLTALHCVAYTGSLPIAKLLLQCPKADAAALDEDRISALHCATQCGHLDIVKLLLQRPEVSVFSSDRFGMTPLHYAVRSRRPYTRAFTRRIKITATITATKSSELELQEESFEIIKLIFNRPNVSAATSTLYAESPLHTACRHGDLKVVKLLLERPEVDVRNANAKGQMPIHFAALSRFDGGSDVVQFLLKQPSVRLTDVDSDNRTVLHFLSATGHRCSIKPLIEAALQAGIGIDDYSTYGTAFHQAVERCQFENALTLLSYGANPMIPHQFSFNNSLLHLCVRLNASKKDKKNLQTKLVAELISRGVEIDTYTDCHFGTDEDWEPDNDDAIRNPDLRTVSDATPLFFAAATANNVDAMTLLLDAGADPTVSVYIREEVEEDLTGSSRQAFLAALFRHAWVPEDLTKEGLLEYKEAIVLLLRHGARLDHGGRTKSPLEEACRLAEHGFCDLLILLLGVSSAKNVKFRHVQNIILEYSSWPEHENIVHLLRDFVGQEFKEKKV
ncbi:hypothetical protein FZEAL_2825 [Fusarium zealandicum]|uniref:Ankyrin n=1 Tax=Fusarium zealandicum TaxID=1053134 RepID=A0A8H4XNG9_9HYPO|nr:hypothetical protein FZEAL_2825 [Fusarium zealandicum]